MTIRTVEYDEGYENFLVVYMMDYFNPVNDCEDGFVDCTLHNATDDYTLK